MTNQRFLSELPEQLYLASQVRELDRIAIEDFGTPGFDLMQKAARFAFHQLIKKWPETKRITVYCGAGNNAGDGYLLASIAAKQGIHTNVIALTETNKLSGDARRAYDTCAKDQIDIAMFRSDQVPPSSSASSEHVLVDALLGTGLDRPVTGLFSTAIETINASALPVLAIDIPSGLCSDTGQPNPDAVVADITTTFIGNKLGLMTGKGRDFAGEIRFGSLNIPPETYEQFKPELSCPDLNQLIDAVPESEQSSHKGQHGRALIIGGNHGFGGAILLASKACARMGAGLTSCFTREEHVPAMLQTQPEVMAHSTEHPLDQLINTSQVVALGPGLGQDDWAVSLMKKVLASNAFKVFDADALNLLAKYSELRDALNGQHVLTPHPGEAARLLDCTVPDVEKNRLESVRELSQRYGGTVVLKGSGSLISNIEKDFTALCRYGNSGMASGGMGDVLTGLTTGLLCRYRDRMEAHKIIELAVLLHSHTADLEAEYHGGIGLLASDLIDRARAVLNKTT